ncbi:MAG: sulfatase, partial [Thermoanaerobaculia bacterium]
RHAVWRRLVLRFREGGGSAANTRPKSMFGSRRLLALVSGLLILATACSREEPLKVSHDLITEFSWAMPRGETQTIDFGSARGRRHLVSGWSIDEWDRPRKTNFVWGIGTESVLEVDLLSPRDLVLKARCRPAPRVEDQRVDVILNGRHLGGFGLRNRLTVYPIRIDEDWLRHGVNELEFRYSDHEPASQEPGEDPRPLAVAWYELLLETEVPADPVEPMVLEEDMALSMPVGTRVDYFLRLAPDSVLEVRGVEVVGAKTGHVEVTLREDGEDSAQLVGTLERTSRPQRLALGGERSKVVRLTLEAPLLGDGSSNGSSVVLRAPTVRSPQNGSVGDPVELVAPEADADFRRPNILLYVIDTLRADHLGIYGYPRPVSPQIDAFAAEATVFDDAVAQSSWTRASMASIFTSLWPLQHATNRRGDVLAPEAVTLAELLREAGYETVAFAKNQNVFPTFGFSQGFDNFNAIWAKGKSHKINERVEKWLKTYNGDRPFFLYLHAVDPHVPYGPPEEFKYQFADKANDDLTLSRPPGPKIWKELETVQRERILDHLLDLYDGEIAYNDSTFGKLLEILRDGSVYDETLIILLSDHGEEFQDHGNWQHGRNLFVENLHVPLLIRFPDRGQGVRVKQRVQHIDLLPTLLDYLGLGVPEFLEGSSFLSWVTNPQAPVDEVARPAYSFLHLDGLPNVSVIEGEWKLVQNISQGKIAWTNLFDRSEDPGETRNRALDKPILASYLATLIAKRRSEESRLTASEAVLDERMEEALKALGYVN